MNLQPAETPGVSFISKRVNLIPAQQGSVWNHTEYLQVTPVPFVKEKIGPPAVIDRRGRQTLIKSRERVAFITTGQLRAVMDVYLARQISLSQG